MVHRISNKVFTLFSISNVLDIFFSKMRLSSEEIFYKIHDELIVELFKSSFNND